MRQDRDSEVRAAFGLQAEFCRRLGSPFTALLCSVLGECLDRASEVGCRILDWQGQPDHMYDALPLRLAGGLNALVRRGAAPTLGAFYPPAPAGEPEALWRVLRTTLQDHADELAPWLESPPQTNEVARSTLPMAGLLVIADRFKLPLALHELGASAGLNLMLDRYHYRLGGLEAGVPSALHLEPLWQGPAPPAAKVRILRRRGVDLAPLDVGKADDRERLAAYVWPDQVARLARLEAALAIVAPDPPPLDRGDAAAWAQSQIAEAPEAEVTRVVTHTIAFQYFPAETKARLVRHFDQVGRNATAAAPFAWLRFESVEQGTPELRLTTWPEGREERLGTGDAHGGRICWMHES